MCQLVTLAGFKSQTRQSYRVSRKHRERCIQDVTCSVDIYIIFFQKTNKEFDRKKHFGYREDTDFREVGNGSLNSVRRLSCYT